MSKEMRMRDILLQEDYESVIDPIINALIGILRSNDGSKGVYSYIKSVETLVDQGNTPEEAVDFCYKILREASGPIIVDDTGV